MAFKTTTDHEHFLLGHSFCVVCVQRTSQLNAIELSNVELQHELQKVRTENKILTEQFMDSPIHKVRYDI